MGPAAAREKTVYGDRVEMALIRKLDAGQAIYRGPGMLRTVRDGSGETTE
jgi:hypothetical protein